MIVFRTMSERFIPGQDGAMKMSIIEKGKLGLLSQRVDFLLQKNVAEPSFGIVTMPIGIVLQPINNFIESNRKEEKSKKV